MIYTVMLTYRGQTGLETKILASAGLDLVNLASRNVLFNAK